MIEGNRITGFKIETVAHPRADLPQFANVTYLALTYEEVSYDGYPRGKCHLNMKYVDDTLKDHLRTKQISAVDYLEAMSIVKEYRDEKELARRSI